MEKNFTYTIQIERDEDGVYVVSVPALPGCYTEGQTFDEAMKMAQEAIVAFITILARRGKPIPVERKSMLSPFMVSVSAPVVS